MKMKTRKVMKIFPESASAKEASVKDLIEKHRVCYEWCNEYDMVNDVRTSIGYSLRLYGCNIKHEVDGGCETEPVPGCPVCRKTYDDLVCVARWILPTEKRESQYKIEPFDSAFHFAPRRGLREEIVVSIQIVHREDPGLPKDECEGRCLNEMCANLKRLGVLEGSVNHHFGEHREDSHHGSTQVA